MIRQSIYGVSPKVEFTVGGVPFDYSRVNRIKIGLHEDQHDMATLTVAGLPTRAITDYVNAPVTLTVSTGGNYSQTIVGSIVDVRPESTTAHGTVENSPFQEADLIILGASYRMRGDKTRSWVGYSLTDIASEMAVEYGFSLDVPVTQLLASAVEQLEESDWQFLVRYANSLGYSVVLHGTHLHVFDPAQAKGRNISFNRLLTIRKTKGDTDPYPGQINHFIGSFAEHSPQGDYKETIVDVRPEGAAESFPVSSTELATYGGGVPVYQHTVSNEVATYEEAIRTIKATQRDNWDYSATASVMGLAGCQPGGFIALDNYNSGFDGLWYVQGIEHEISTDRFWSELSLVRNKLELPDSNVPSLRPAPLPRYINGRWEATRKTVRTY